MKQPFNQKYLPIYGAVFMVLAGSLLHFTYQWSGDNLLVGFVSAMNESVWEHSKLFILPLAVWGVVEYRSGLKLDRLLFAKLVQFTFMSLFITTFFYTYTGALGVEENLYADIGSFIFAVAVGQHISHRITYGKRSIPLPVKSCATLLVFTFLCFIYFSLAPPNLPLFESA